MKIIGTGSALPHRVVTNGDMESFLDTTDDWIVSRTGAMSSLTSGWRTWDAMRP